MSKFYCGLAGGMFCVSPKATSKALRAKNRTRPVKTHEPHSHSAIDVIQDGAYIVITGSESSDNFLVTHQRGIKDNPYDDKIVVSWTTNGVTQSKSFDLYKYVFQDGEMQAVRNVSALEFEGGVGNDKFWNQTDLITYLSGEVGNVELCAATIEITAKVGPAPTSAVITRETTNSAPTGKTPKTTSSPSSSFTAVTWAAISSTTAASKAS